MVKVYLYLGLAAIISVGGVLYTYWVYDKGRAAERARTAAQVEEMREAHADKIKELEAENAKERVVYKTRIKVVRQAADPTACADTPMPAAILEQLRQ